MSKRAGRKLVISAGSTRPWDIELVDENGDAEDLSAVDAATFRISHFVGATLAADIVIERSILDGNLTANSGTDPDTDPSYLRATLTQVEADALTPGAYVGVAAMRFGSADWQSTEEIEVEIVADSAQREGP